MPTLRDYNMFKYLWYVGLSRSMYQLRIYVDCNKYVWPLIKDMPTDLYKLEYNNNDLPYLDKNILKYYRNISFDEKREIIIHKITELLGNLKPEELYNLETTVQYTYDTIDIYNVDDAPELYMINEFSALYGIFIERIHQYFYYIYSNNITELHTFFSNIRDSLMNQITISKKYNYICKSIINRLGYKITDILDIQVFDTHKISFTEYEYDFYDFLKTELSYNNNHNSHNNHEFTIQFENDLYYHARNDVIKICDEMIHDYTNANYISNIFKIVLYYYQIEHECGYLWQQDFTQHLETLQFYIDKIKKHVETSIIENTYTNLLFSIHTSHPNIPLIGEIDISTDNEIIDIKFTNSFTSRHVYQLLLYYNNVYPAWNIKKDLVVYNFKLGKKYTIHIDEHIYNYDILQWFCMTTGKLLKNIALCNNTSYYIEYNLGFVMCCPDKINKFLSYCYKPTIISYDTYTNDIHATSNQNESNTLYNKDCKVIDSKYIIRMLYLEKDTITLSFKDTYNLIFNNHNSNGDNNDSDNDDPIHTIKMLIDLLKKLKYTIVIV